MPDPVDHGWLKQGSTSSAESGRATKIGPVRTTTISWIGIIELPWRQHRFSNLLFPFQARSWMPVAEPVWLALH